jgi:5-methylcytosine-specific restriction endonuclease McrA
MCGKSLTEDEVQIEHKFPKTMGGSNELSNLKIACEYCNNEKKNYIDASDFHYEHISLSTNDDDESFNLEFKRSYKIALWAKSDYSCVLCGQLTEFIGRLDFVRRNPNDSWHFLNIDAVCERCLTQTEGENDR